MIRLSKCIINVIFSQNEKRQTCSQILYFLIIFESTIDYQSAKSYMKDYL